MKRIHLLLGVIMVLTVIQSGCIGGGVFYKETLTGRFAFWAVDSLTENSLVEESVDGRAARVLVEPTVFAAGFDDQFIIVARHPRHGVEVDRTTTEYFVVSLVDSAVHGPATAESFPELRVRLGVSPQLQLSKRIEQLAGGQSANPRVKPPARIRGLRASLAGRRPGTRGLK